MDVYSVKLELIDELLRLFMKMENYSGVMKEPLGSLRILYRLVTVLQMLGLFPYSWQASNGGQWSLSFNIPLMLLVIFTKIMVCLNIHSTVRILMNNEDISIGGVSYMLSNITVTLLYGLISFILVCNSASFKNTLVKLHTSSVGKSTSITKCLRPMYQKWFQFSCLSVLSYVSSLDYLISAWKGTLPVQMFNVSLLAYSYAIMIVVCFLFDATLSILGTHLSEKSQQVTQNMSKYVTQQEGTISHVTHTSSKMKQLYILEKSIREVRTQAKTLALYLYILVQVHAH